MLKENIAAKSLAGRELNRFKFIQKYLLSGTKSILDVGCSCGHWLNYITQKRHFEKHLGIDISSARIQEGKKQYPQLDIRMGTTESLEPLEKYDAVTCLEVLEHIPDWLPVFNGLFKFSQKQVIITVPYKEVINYTICIHCLQKTPYYGHMHSFSESSFPQKEGWSFAFVKIPDKNPKQSFARRLYRFIKPRYPWLLVVYNRK